MSDWLKTNAVGMALIVIVVAGLLIGYGHSKAGIERLAIIEARQIEILERVSHLEGRYTALGE